MAIPNTFLDELAVRCPIEEVVADYVPLTPKGGNLWGLCPFHGEKTPSFSVSPDKHIFHCFGCGKGGGVIRFVMEIEGLSFYEAVEKLALRAGLEVPQEDDGERQRRARRRRLLELNRQAARFYHDTLKSPLGEPMRAYVAKRQLSGAYVKRFGLGAAPNGWDHLTRAMTALGYEKGELLEAGLVVANKSGGVYDKFRNRLMLPVIDAAGEVLGFTSRVMDDSTPKYLNTPETSLFKKRSILYGINFAKQTKHDFFLLVEGNLDVITLHQAGFDNAVATMGTALTPDHARILSRYTKELVLCYDNDEAGKKATQRSLGILKDADLTVRVLQLPNAVDADGKPLKQDPDDFVKKFGPAAFERCLNGSAGQNDYRLDVLLQSADLQSEDGRRAFLEAAVETVGSLQSPIDRELYGAKAAAAGGVSANAFHQTVEQWRKGRVRMAQKKEQRQNLAPTMTHQPKSRELRYTNIRSARAEEGLLRLVSLDPTLLERMPVEPEEFSSPLLGKVFSLLKERHGRGLSVQLSTLAGKLTADEMSHMVEVLSQPESLANAETAMNDYIKTIKAEARQRENPNSGEALLELRRRQREKAMEDGQ